MPSAGGVHSPQNLVPLPIRSYLLNPETQTFQASCGINGPVDLHQGFLNGRTMWKNTCCRVCAPARRWIWRTSSCGSSQFWVTNPGVSAVEGNCVKVCCIWLFSHPPGFHRQRIQLWYNNLTPLKQPDPVVWQPLLYFMFPYILKAVENYGQQHLNCTFIHFGLWPHPIPFNLPYPPAFPMGDLTYTLW